MLEISKAISYSFEGFYGIVDSFHDAIANSIGEEVQL